VAAHFDKILFLISTDCFTDQLFGEFSPQDVESVKQAARDAVPDMVRGGDNYFMCADFSPERVEKTRLDFFANLLAQQVGVPIQRKIGLFHEALQGITDQLRTASNVIGSVAARLYWLDIDHFKTPITDELVDLIAMVAPLGLDRESHGFEWEDIWLSSPSEWDRFLMSLMDGIDEVPYLTFVDVMKFSSRLDFLYAWKKYLGEPRFSGIRHYIQAEAHAELDAINPVAAKEIDQIMSTL